MSSRARRMIRMNDKNGFPMDEWVRRKIGPVVLKDEVEYYKEVRLLQPLRITLMLAGLADDGSRFSIRAVETGGCDHE